MGRFFCITLRQDVPNFDNITKVKGGGPKRSQGNAIQSNFTARQFVCGAMVQIQLQLCLNIQSENSVIHVFMSATLE